MRFPVRLILLMLLSSTSAHADAPSMSGYMNCARAMGVAINEKFAVIPGEQSGDKGLYIYTDRSVYFLSRGAPRIQVGEAYEYYLRTNIAGVGDIFLDSIYGVPHELQSAVNCNGVALVALQDSGPDLASRSIIWLTARVSQHVEYSARSITKTIFRHDRPFTIRGKSWSQ